MTPLQQAAYDIGAKGSEPTETERIAFEAWMRGHCWKVEGDWNGRQYVHAHESNGFAHGGAINTRRLWAAWRDRGALAAQQTPSAATDELALTASGEIMSVMYGAMPLGGSVQLRAMVQCVVQRAIDAQQVALPQWTLTADQMPEPCTSVLAYTGKQPIRAQWVPEKTLEDNGGGDFGEYDEATDTYYWPEGWYEWNQNEETHWLVTEPVTHWMPLPHPPQGDTQ